MADGDSDFERMDGETPRLDSAPKTMSGRSSGMGSSKRGSSSGRHKKRSSGGSSIPLRSGGSVTSELTDLHNIVWREVDLLDRDDYRRKLWNYVAHQLHCPKDQDEKYDYELWKKERLPSAEESMTVSRYRLTDEQLDLMLSRHETYKRLLPSSSVVVLQKLIEVLKNILSAYACANNNTLPLNGAIQLCLALYVTTNQEEMTFYLLQILTDIVLNDSRILMKRAFRILGDGSEIPPSLNDSDWQQYLANNAALVVVDEVFGSDSNLRDKLNQMSVDVVDLVQTIRSWISSFYAYHFDLKFLQRMIDVVLVDGYMALVSTCFGVLSLVSNDMKSKSDMSGVFGLLRDIPTRLSGKLKKDVLAKSESMFAKHAGLYIPEQMATKSWDEMRKLCGKKHFEFAPQSGDVITVKRKLKSAHTRKKTEKTDKLFEVSKAMQEELDDSDGEFNGHHFRYTSGAMSAGAGASGRHHSRGTSGNESLVSLANTLQREIDKLEDELEIARATIDELRKKKRQKSSDGGSGSLVAMGDASLIHGRSESSVSGSATGAGSGDSSAAASGGSSGSSSSGSGSSVSGGVGSKMESLCEMLHVSLEDRHLSKSKKTSDAGVAAVVTGAFNILLEPIPDLYSTREIEINHKDWTDSWKRQMSKLSDSPHFSMQGYMYKLVHSSFGKGLERKQKRWFVVRESMMTYFRTSADFRPKNDRCRDLTGWIVNPVADERSHFAIELVSPPVEVSAKKKRKTSEEFERLKYVLIPYGETDAELVHTRDMWIQALRLATHGTGVWDRMLHLSVAGADLHSSTPYQRRRSARYSHKASHSTASPVAVASSSYGYSHGHGAARSVINQDFGSVTSTKFGAFRASEMGTGGEPSFY